MSSWPYRTEAECQREMSAYVGEMNMLGRNQTVLPLVDSRERSIQACRLRTQVHAMGVVNHLLRPDRGMFASPCVRRGESGCNARTW